MTASPDNDSRCSVQRPELLPPETGGAAFLCDEIERATAASGSVKVIVTVLSANQLKAAITDASGQRLPELQLNKSDRPLSRASLQRFAQSIAAAAAAVD
jgi:hypothetical protein